MQDKELCQLIGSEDLSLILAERVKLISEITRSPTRIPRMEEQIEELKRLADLTLEAYFRECGRNQRL